MFDIGWSELLVIAVIAVVVVGPKDLPRMLRAFGIWTGKMRRMAGDFQRQFNDALRETEIEELKKTAAEINKGDPFKAASKDLQAAAAKLDASIPDPAAASGGKPFVMTGPRANVITPGKPLPAATPAPEGTAPVPIAPVATSAPVEAAATKAAE